MTRMRVFCLLLLAAFVGCTDDESPQAPETKPGNATPKKKPEPVAPETGIKQIQKSYDMWARIVAAEEKKEKADVNQLTVEQTAGAMSARCPRRLIFPTASSSRTARSCSMSDPVLTRREPQSIR